MQVIDEKVEGLIVGGEQIPAASRKTSPDYDPATGEVLAVVAAGASEDIDVAVKNAADSFAHPSWRGMKPAERGRVLLSIADAIRAASDHIARLECLDTGKPLRQARADTETCARYFEFYGGAADKILGTSIPLGPSYVDYTVREPLGVSGHIVPWNYPLQIFGRGVAAALAAGNAVVVKPATQSPLTALYIGRLALDSGLPGGILNIVPGSGPDAGTALASHPLLNQLTFTGSIETGTQVMQLAAQHAIPVTLELGGKSPQIVFADADLDLAVEGVANGIYQHAGQTCSAGSRLLIERKLHDEFIELLRTKVSRMRLGPGIEDPDMGPLISAEHRARVLDYIDVGTSEGATVVYGGKEPSDSRLSGGSFLEPTLMQGARSSMRIAQEEIFGPVLVAMPFDELEEAIEIANDTKFGLLTGIWTRDINKALTLADAVQAGQVYVNTFGAGGGAELPFGGYRQSGFGREKGLEGLLGYTQVKNVCIKYGT